MILPKEIKVSPMKISAHLLHGRNHKGKVHLLLSQEGVLRSIYLYFSCVSSIIVSLNSSLVGGLNF